MEIQVWAVREMVLLDKGRTDPLIHAAFSGEVALDASNNTLDLILTFFFAV